MHVNTYLFENMLKKKENMLEIKIGRRGFRIKMGYKIDHFFNNKNKNTLSTRN